MGKLTDGQARVKNINWDDEALEEFVVDIRPNAGLYKGGIFEFRVSKLLVNPFCKDLNAHVHTY